MISLLKAIIPGAILTWLVATLIGSRGSKGGILAIGHITYNGHDYYGSWPLFIASTALAWMIFLIMK